MAQSNTINLNTYKAKLLSNGRTFQVYLNSTSASTAFDGSANISNIGVSGILGIGYGGTGTDSTPTQYGVIYAGTTSAYDCTAAGTADYLLQGNGNSAAPSWVQSTDSNVKQTIVRRDNSDGGFSAGTITTANITSAADMTISTTSSKTITISSASTLKLSSGTGAEIIFYRGGTSASNEVARFDTSGNFIPKSTGSNTIGTANIPWTNIYATSITGALTGNASTATKLYSSVTLWGQTFDGSANITGSLTGAGPSLVLPAGETTYGFYTSVLGAANANFGRLGLADGYTNINLSTYRLHVVGTADIMGLTGVSGTYVCINYNLTGYNSWSAGINSSNYFYFWNSNLNDIGFYITKEGYTYAVRTYTAVWNDYAEYRQVSIDKPGYCVTESSNGIMKKSTERLQAGCKIISDTFGTCMGKTETAKTPIAVAGRVLAYPYRAREEYSLGAAVCSAPDGTIDIMTREEIMMYPERIIGTVSEIPDYDVWHAGQKGESEVAVNGRIWIYVK